MIKREFAGKEREFQLLPANRFKLYSGLEVEYAGGEFADLAMKIARSELLSASDIFNILSHALSGGHSIGLMNARKLVMDEIVDKPLAAYQPLIVEIITDLYAGTPDDNDIPQSESVLREAEEVSASAQ